MNSARCIAGLVAGALLIFVAGCDTGPRMIPVSGVVTLDGKPVKNAAVMFLSTSGGRPAEGITDAEGRYSLTTFKFGDGAVEGQHSVSVTGVESIGNPGSYTPEGMISGSGTQREIWFVPQKYSNPATAGIQCEVSPSQNKHDFDLKSVE
ncbi:hypothetical protein ETAA8_10740 [Anatilimnocola aggregata]|uniref:Carboxypeptidase regulatory-like domain-containing protein n=1 Tax=Anatilimnocola aggregata TaxID=2528021 RepID=A0A517Y789_9BACT|nr:carboxypeptidase-like regulatory domain-containing protein [Anatilimnocola aggregata]QDU26002.1 hypothetical protein ETAA8_10740 [Anatilimnocola aggregata]